MRVLIKRFTSNQSSFVLIRNREVVTDLILVTKVIVIVDGVNYGSDVYPLLFSWNGTLVYQDRVSTNYISVQLGLMSLPLGTFNNCSMVVYLSGVMEPYSVFNDAVFVVEDL